MIRTTCAYCGVGCGIAATVTGPREVEIKGDPAHPANRGKLCSKGTWLGETLGLEGRLLTPMIGERRATWSNALADVAARMLNVIEQYGPGAVAFYLSGQLLTEDYYVANKLAKGFIGTGHVDTNSRLCMASAVAAHNRAFGEDVVPVSYDDLDEADLILLVGSNTAWCHPVIWQRIEAARATRGTRLVVIDPRRTETAAGADLHIPIAPDGDVALFTALLAEMRERGRVDEDYLAEHCEVPEGFWDQFPPFPSGEGAGGWGLSSLRDARPIRTAPAPNPSTEGEGPSGGIDPALFTQLADLVAAHPRMITMFSQGANQSTSGTDKGNAIINLHLATGRINAPGAGPFSITGQPNAMGGREVGGLANMLACHLGFSDEERTDVAAFWDAPNIVTGPGDKAVDMFRAIHDGRIKFVWVMATNPAVSMPDAGFVREALAKCPHVVVSEVIADTDTARLAHVRLPALGWAEKDGTVTNSERMVSRQRALLPPPGEARADWRIMCDVAALMGHGAAFDFANAAAVFREYAAMTSLAVQHGKALDLTDHAAISDAGFDALEPFQWGGRHPLASRYSTPSGKARLVNVAAPAPLAGGDYPLRLNTGRYRDHWHTMTRTGLSPKLSQHRREPLLEVHPDDADALTNGGFARVVTAAGASLYRVAISEGQRRGDLFVPMHFTDATGAGGRTGRLMHQLTDPISGQPGFKNVPARVEPWQPDWRGVLVSRDPATPDAAYWARARIAGGWMTELAGLGAVDVEALLPPGARSEVADMARGMRRIAVTDAAGAPLALLYLTRAGTLPERGWIEGQFAAPAAPAGLVELLAGRPATPAPDRGAVVCLCHDVRTKDVIAALDGGAGDVAAVGTCTRAGTNCGSCRPLIAQIIAEHRIEEPAQ